MMIHRDLIAPTGGGTGMTPAQTRDLTNVTHFADSMALDKLEIAFTDNGTDVTATVDNDNHLHQFYLDGTYHEVTLPMSVELQLSVTQDHITYQNMAFEWSEENGGEIILSNSLMLPNTANNSVAYVGMQRLVDFQNHGLMFYQRTTDAISHDGQGSQARERQKSRLMNGNVFGGWFTGFETNYVEASQTGIGVEILSGFAYQMNLHYLRPLSSIVDGFYVDGVSEDNANLVGYSKHNTFTDLKWLRDGTPLVTGKFYVYNVGILNNSGDEQKIDVTLPTTAFDTVEEAAHFVETSIGHDFDPIFRTVYFPVARVILKYLGGGNFTNGYTTTSEETITGWHNVSIPYRSWTSPNYPNNYPNGANVVTSKTDFPAGTTKIKLNFSAHNTEANYDYTYIDDDNSVGSSHYQYRYSGYLGNFETQEIRVDGNGNIYIRFTSDGSVQKTGWNVNDAKAYYPVTTSSTDPSHKIHSSVF